MIKKIMIVIAVLVLIVAGAGIFLTVRSALALNQIEQEWQTTRVDKIQELGTTRTLEILPLFEEAQARDDVELEHGVSYLVRTDSQNILVDVGTTPARLSHNLQALDIHPADFHTVLITHAHPDHTGGVNAWWESTFVPGDPPLDLNGKRVYVPTTLSRAGVEPIVVTQPAKIAEGVATIGALPFPDLFPLSLKSPRNTEQTLAVNVQGQGIVLVMGCGHPTVERIVARAQALFDEPIIGLVGGLHYEGLTREQTQPHIAFVKNLKPQLVAISPHDSSPAALQAFQEAFPQVYQEVAVGRTILIANSR